MSKEAMKMALEALKTYHYAMIDAGVLDRQEVLNQGFTAAAAIKEALAEQPAQQALDKMAENARELGLDYEPAPMSQPNRAIAYSAASKLRELGYEWVADAWKQPAQQQEPVAWISVKDALPKAVQGVSYNASLTDVVLVRHSDRPDYPITAHAVVGEGLGAGIAIPTEGASEHPEIAWYSASSNLNNPFDLKNDDYGRYLPKVFGLKITHWKPIDTSPPAQRKPLTDEWLPVTQDLLNEQHPWLYQPMWIAMKGGVVVQGYYEWRQGRNPDRFITDLGDEWAFNADFVMPITKPTPPAIEAAYGIKQNT